MTNKLYVEYVDGEIDEFSNLRYIKGLSEKLKKGIKEIYDLPDLEDFVKDNIKDLRKILEKYKYVEDKEND